MEYKFSGKITLEDYIQFNNNLYKNKHSGKIKVIFHLVLFGIIFFSLLQLIMELIKLESEILREILLEPKFIFNMSLIVLGILFIIFIDKIWSIIARKFYKKIYESNKLMTALENYTITKDNISIINDNENVNITKDKIYKIQYDTDSINIFIGINMAYIIKKRFLENDEVFDELNIFIKENFDKNKSK